MLWCWLCTMKSRLLCLVKIIEKMYRKKSQNQSTLFLLFYSNGMQLRREDLQTWCNSPYGIECCRASLDRITARIPTCAGPCRVCIGYVLGLNTRYENSDPITSGLNVIIDYGGESLLTAVLSLRLLLVAFRFSQNNSITHGVGDSAIMLGNMFDDANLLCTLSQLSKYFQINQTLLHFSLETPSCYGDEQPMPKITGISLADAGALARLHLNRAL